MHHHQNALHNWLQAVLKRTDFSLLPLTGDASFRCYYRLSYAGISRIVMEAPPEKEPLRPFINIAHLLRQQAINAPLIHTYDEQLGFAILDDFGDTLLLNKVKSQDANSLYQQACKLLIKMQNCSLPSAVFSPAFMLQELELFKIWFMQDYLKLTLSREEEQLINQTCEWLVNEINCQPQVFIHRDYHSRNIMVLEQDNRLGIIDFQDAMVGPIAYDLVSLLKDCYIQWSDSQIRQWLTFFHQHSLLAQQLSLQAFHRAFDLCGLQRHLKVLGVFCRLYLRDNKPNYLKDLPLTLSYVMACLNAYPELQALLHFMQQRIYLP